MIQIQLTSGVTINGQKTCDATELHRQLGESTPFEDWVLPALADACMRENRDYRHSVKPDGTVVVHVVEDAARKLVIMSPTASGKEYRQHLIEIQESNAKPGEHPLAFLGL